LEITEPDTQLAGVPASRRRNTEAILPKCNYIMPGLLRVMGDWRPEELANLVAAFSKGLPPANLDAEELKAQIQDHFHYAYNHAVRLALHAAAKNAVRGARNLGRMVRSKIARAETLERIPYVRRHLLGRKVDYPFLVRATARALKVYDGDLNPENPEDLNKLELYISHRVIATALDRMSAKQRYDFFTQTVDPRSVSVPRSAIRDAKDLIAPFTQVARANSTALGFVTYAAGLSLPYVVYQGMANTVAFTLGPVGWLGAGLWAGLRLTSPNWRKLSTAIIYISAVKAVRSEQ